MLALPRKYDGPLTREITPRDFVIRGCTVIEFTGLGDRLRAALYAVGRGLAPGTPSFQTA